MIEDIEITKANTGLVSVIMNCYNSDKFLKEAIDSVLMQSYENLEIIFWDNRSTDDSSKIINAYTDPRIKYFFAEKHTRLGAARMLAMTQATGEFIAFLDCDDEWMPNRLAVQMPLMASKDIDYCYAGHFTENENNDIFGKFVPEEKSGDLFSSLVYFFNIDMVTPLIRTKACRSLGINFNPEIYAAEEINFFLRLALHAKGMAIGCILGKSRWLKSSLTRQTGPYWHRDIDVTIAQLRFENPAIDETYPVEMRYLEFKSLYLKTKWLMMEGKYSEAQREFERQPYYDFRIYRFLRQLCHFPFFWKLAHACLDNLVNLRSSSLLRRIVSH